MSTIRIFFIALFSFAQLHVIAQSDSLKTEMRAVWIATVDNIDYPDFPTVNSQVQKDAFIRLLDTHHKNGIPIYI